jgi:hypothetical protein
MPAALNAAVLTDDAGSLIAGTGIGHQAGVLQPDGFIRQIVMFPGRKTNAELQAWAQAA